MERDEGSQDIQGRSSPIDRTLPFIHHHPFVRAHHNVSAIRVYVAVCARRCKCACSDASLLLREYLPELVPVEVPEHKAKEWFHSLLSGVQFLHSRGVVHNDIK
jgi:serine/threonine protein kinase